MGAPTEAAGELAVEFRREWDEILACLENATVAESADILSMGTAAVSDVELSIEASVSFFGYYEHLYTRIGDWTGRCEDRPRRTRSYRGRS